MSAKTFVKSTIKKIPGAKKVYSQLWFQKHLLKCKTTFNHYITDESRYYLIFSHGIGDVVWACSFIQPFIKSNHFENLTLVCSKRDRNLIHSYVPDAQFVCTSIPELQEIGLYGTIHGKSMKNVRVIIYPELKKDMTYDLELYANTGMEMDICYKYGCFDLSDWDKFCPPNLTEYKQQAEQIVLEHKMPRGKSVVLIPYVNSRLHLPIEFWERLSKELISHGYKVYTNVGRDTDKPISGTTALFTPLEVLPLVVKMTGCVISGRCGLGDWVFINSCNLIVLHAFTDKTDRMNKIQSSFARKESFHVKKYRCGIKGEVREFRINYATCNADIYTNIANNTDEIISKVEEE